MQGGYLYILSNKNRTVLYVGTTTDIKRRVWEHKNRIRRGFTERYNVFELMYVESYFDLDEAMALEKKIKRWRGEWKWNLIKERNPDVLDLAKDWFDANGDIIPDN